MPTLKVAPGLCVELLVATSPQLVVAVGGVHVAVCEHAVFPIPVDTLTVVGQPVMVGVPMSVMVIILLTGASALPHTSVAVQVSVTVPLHAGDEVNVDAFDVPLTKQPPLNPLLNERVDEPGILLIQPTVIFPGAVIVGKAAGLTVIVLDTDAIVLPHDVAAVQVSVTSPPHAFGVALNVDGFDVPLIKHPLVKPLVNEIVLAAGTLPHATVVAAGAVIVGKAAGLTIIVLDTDAIVLLHASVAVHVSVTSPPHAPGVAVNVEPFDVPDIKHPSVKPLVKLILLAAGTPPHATVVAAGAVIVGNAAGLTVIV